MFQELNIILRSHIDIKDVFIPLEINIENIAEEGYNVSHYKIQDLTIKKSEITYTIDTTASELLAREYNYKDFLRTLKYIWKHIDTELQDENPANLISRLKITTFEEFKVLVMESDIIDISDINRMLDTIMFYENKVKKMFTERAVELMEIKKEYPEIQLKKDDFSMFVSKYNDYYQYNYFMTSLQSVSEYPMGIIFPENIGKAYSKFSWREQELKRLYLTAKHVKDNFKETVKAKAMENNREKQQSSQHKGR